MIRAVIFDKDGTLFDFTQSWGGWTRAFLAEITPDGAEQVRLAQVLGFDLATGRFTPDSVVIASTMEEITGTLHAAMPGSDFDDLWDKLTTVSLKAEMVPAVDLPAVLGALKARGLVLGLATNDTEAPARAHLAAAGVLHLFDFVAGCDSGWGGKPAPGQLNAFAAAHGLDPATAAMVGDSRHDLHAARAAGMKAVAVLTGVAKAADLAPDADVVMATIAELPGWIDALAG